MQVLRHIEEKVNSLWVYSVPDDLIKERFSTLENFQKLIVADDNSAIFWLEDVMIHQKGVSKTFADESTKRQKSIWDMIIPKAPAPEPKPPKPKAKKKKKDRKLPDNII